MTEREEFMLRMALDYDVHRYMMVNSKGREDGSERATRHINISKTLVQFITCKERALGKIIMHDILAYHLTSRMDEVIQFPINLEMAGDMFTHLANKFIDWIIDNFEMLETEYNEKIKNESFFNDL